MVRSTEYRIPANASGFRSSEHIEAAVGALGNRGTWILFLDLLVNACGFRRLALAEQVGELDQNQWPGNENGFRVGNGAIGLDGVISLSGTSVYVGHLILG